MVMLDERLERAVMVELDELPDTKPSVGMGDTLIAAAKDVTDNTAEGLADIFIPYVEEDF